jgi:hypothetical protein
MNCRPMPSPKRSSTPSLIAITTAMHPSKSGYSPIGSKSGIPVNFPERCRSTIW